MSRATRIYIDEKALIHNLNQIKLLARGSQILAMVKADAYGCGLEKVVPVLEGRVDAFGVACLSEALKIRRLGVKTSCVLMQGAFSPDDIELAQAHNFQIVLHQPHQLNWLLSTKLKAPIKVWIKVNTGMHRLGFKPEELDGVLAALNDCSWVHKDFTILSHFAFADEPENPNNDLQFALFNQLNFPSQCRKSMANSAAILSQPRAHFDIIRPGIMLYGVSPFFEKTGKELGLKPVMHFLSELSAIHHYEANKAIGYSGTWKTKRPSVIGVVAAGYGDGYPRYLSEQTYAYINGQRVPIVGRVSMDMLTIDLTDCTASIRDSVELWGSHIPVEQVAKAANTIGYELLCRFKARV